MLLEYTDRTNSVTDDELLSDLCKASKETGKQSLTIAEYEEHGHYDPTTIMRHFGTWNNALHIHQWVGLYYKEDHCNTTAH